MSMANKQLELQIHTAHAYTHFKDHHLEFVAVQLPRARQDRGSLARSGRSVEQQVRQLVAVNQLRHCRTETSVVVGRDTGAMSVPSANASASRTIYCRSRALQQLHRVERRFVVFVAHMIDATVAKTEPENAKQLKPTLGHTPSCSIY